jgi:anti-anti-sigma factor
MELSPRRFADTLVLSPRGRIDHANAGELQKYLWPWLGSPGAGPGRLVLDLSGLPYISSAGLRVLLMASKQVKAQGGTLAVAGLQAVVREIFDISKFTLVFPVFPTVRAAVEAGSPEARAAFEVSPQSP